ncbi:hypothetical protein LB534_28760, partial [Mesorhizobium sp. CA18]|uniref:hypothetical protein n=1 Tax=unclassified Mesorhizobium TaxID=325217 RepID=UPI001CCF6411
MTGVRSKLTPVFYFPALLVYRMHTFPSGLVFGDSVHGSLAHALFMQRWSTPTPSRLRRATSPPIDGVEE